MTDTDTKTEPAKPATRAEAREADTKAEGGKQTDVKMAVSAWRELVIPDDEGNERSEKALRLTHTPITVPAKQVERVRQVAAASGIRLYES